MATRPKRPRDTNQLAKMVVSLSIGEEVDKSDNNGKNPAAVALGRLGGIKGGKARAESLSPKKKASSALSLPGGMRLRPVAQFNRPHPARASLGELFQEKGDQIA